MFSTKSSLATMTMPVPRTVVCRIAGLILSVFGFGVEAADLSATLSSLRGAGVSLTGISVSVPVDGSHETGFELTAERAVLDAQGLQFDDLSLRCLQFTLESAAARCTGGVLAFSHSGRTTTVGVEFTHGADGTRFEAQATDFLTGSLQISGRLSDGGSELDLSFELAELETATTIQTLVHWPSSLVLADGALKAVITLVDGEGEAHVHLRDLAWSDESGLRAAEELDVDVQGTFSANPAGWLFEWLAEISRGVMIHDSFLLQAARPPQRLTLSGSWNTDEGLLNLEHIAVVHPGVFDVSGAVTIGIEPLRLEAALLEVPPTTIAAVYQHYLQALAWHSPFAELELDGEFGLNASWRRAGEVSADVVLREINLEDANGRFSLYGLSGELHWNSRVEAALSWVGWEGGSAYAIDFGAATLEGHFTDTQFQLSSALSVPVLDGSVSIDRLEVDNIGTADLQWRTRAALMPVSLPTLTHALGWPAFRGSLAGGIPDIRYADGKITTDGSLVMSVFDGDVLISGLVVEDVFGLVPELRANVDIWGLSLLPLTKAFSFGDIEGRIDGRVHNLVLENWRPTTFDAQFSTPPDDTTRHRISQHAVDSLTELGGGPGALSSTFLGLFESFSYDRLGVSCRLSNGICFMDGVAPAEQGYYIVKGGGFPPRIDVRGFNSRVAWKTLLERLVNVTRSDGPIIQ